MAPMTVSHSERTSRRSVSQSGGPGPSVQPAAPRPSRYAIVAFDGDGRAAAANIAARSLLDVDSFRLDEMLGPLVDRRSTLSGADAADVESTEFQLRSMPDRWLELTVVTSGQADGSCVAIIRDVTLARRDETIGGIIPTLLSHELRTPMTSIYAAAEMLRARGDQPLDDERKSLVADLSAEMRRLQLLVDDLTVLCQDDEALGISIGPELLQRRLPEFIHAQRSRWTDVAIHLEIESEPEMVASDAHALEHVIQDLISNAARRGGTAPITVRLAEHPRGGAVVSVLDGGPAYRERERLLLRPIGFTHLTSESSGAAISLHVAYRLVAAMGGRIWAAGSGTGGEVTFWLRPLDTAAGGDETTTRSDEFKRSYGLVNVQ